MADLRRPRTQRCLALVRTWRTPDYATVNLSEDGAAPVIKALLDAGIGVEAGVWSVEDAERLARSGFGPRVVRILVEPVDLRAADAVEIVDEIHVELDRLKLMAPRLEHGDGEATWILVKDAIRLGIDTRIGLEDTQFEPTGELTTGNEALVRAAFNLGAEQGDF
jgi:uncharacterized protein (DUF849 family)